MRKRGARLAAVIVVAALAVGGWWIGRLPRTAGVPQPDASVPRSPGLAAHSMVPPPVAMMGDPEGALLLEGQVIDVRGDPVGGA